MSNENKNSFWRGLAQVGDNLKKSISDKKMADQKNSETLYNKVSAIEATVEQSVQLNKMRRNSEEELRKRGMVDESTPPFAINHLVENPEVVQDMEQHQSKKSATENEEEENVVKGPTKILDKTKIKSMATNLKTSVFGQDRVIDKVVAVLKIATVGLKVNANRPAGRYFFAGPSGVGKTELAERLAENLGVPILVINMGEYGQEQDISKLIGSAAGLVGYKEGGLLTNFVKKNPACVILFDEIEKADPSMNKLFLSILDKGVCADNKGKDVFFKETIIISTSNLGAEIEYETGYTQEEKDDYRKNVIKENIAPEIINRYDEFFHFNSLSLEVYKMVTNKFIGQVSKAVESANSFGLKFTDKLVDFIVEKSFDPAMGGRPASRFLEQIVLPPLADFMLEDNFEQEAKELKEITLDLNTKNNICFKGKKNKVLGVLQNTAELVADIEKGKFSKKAAPKM